MTPTSRRGLIRAAAGLAAVPAFAVLNRSMAGRFDASLPAMGNAYAVMAADERLTTWVRLIDEAGLQERASGPAPYTVFARTDAAFEDSPETVQALLGKNGNTGPHLLPGTFADTSTLVQFVRSHVIAGKHDPAKLEGKTTDFTSLIGTPIRIDGTQHPMTVRWRSPLDGKDRLARLVDKPLLCVNAVVCIVEQVQTV